MRFSNLILDTDKDVAMLTLDRPERLNALSADLLRELIEAAAAIAESDAHRRHQRRRPRLLCRR